MYLYYDRNGTLKEQINDDVLRGGNENINKIYVYWEDVGTTNWSIWARYVSESKVYYPSSSTYQTSSTSETKTIPYSSKRDLKFFKYYTNYKFYVLDIPSNVLGWGSGSSSHYENGVSAMCSLWFSDGTNIYTMSNISFNIERTTLSVAEDENINVAQWNMLLNLFSGIKKLYKHKLTITCVKDVSTYTINYDAYSTKATPFVKTESLYNYIAYNVGYCQVLTSMIYTSTCTFAESKNYLSFTTGTTSVSSAEITNIIDSVNEA